MPHNNPGYDIESETPDGLDFIEVKGRVEGGDTFVLTRQEAVTALNKGEHSVLALVRVHADDTTTVRYLRQPITAPIDPRQPRVEFDWNHFWNDGTEMEPAVTETNRKRKLIEVALPLDEINAACKADKDRKTGTIRNLHKWFAPMPLPAWRALLFAALVDDPEDDKKRVYLLDLIKRLVENGADLPER